MDNQYAIGAGSAYEYVIAEKKTASVVIKRILLILLYVAWTVGCLVAGVSVRLIVPLLAFIPLTIWILVFLTWRYTQVEYEFSFFSGELTVCRVLGGRSRKVLTKVTIRELASVVPAGEPYTDRINGFGAEKEYWAASCGDSPDLYAAMWKTEDGEKRILWFEPNEKAIKILQFYNRSAVSVKTHEME